MLQWLQQHGTALQVIASFGTLAIWLFYAQLLLSNFLRARRPKILINQGVGARINSRCMVSNMSAEPIFIQCIVAYLETTHGHRTCAVTDFEPNQEADVAATLEDGTGQGPLNPGQYLDLGPFERMLRRVEAAPFSHRGVVVKQPEEPEHVRALAIYVIAVYGSEHSVVGARRRFELLETDDGGFLARPSHVDTLQLRGYAARRQMRGWLREFL